jgi:hypothetical protein
MATQTQTTTTLGTTWFHGTSTESGLELGDTMDPKRGAFEGCVWATSDVTVAKRYAKDVVAVMGGEPVVYELALLESATVVDCTDSGDLDRDDDADACIVIEHGVRVLAIMSRIATAAKEVE